MAFKDKISQILFLFAITQVFQCSICDASFNDITGFGGTNKNLQPFEVRLYSNVVHANRDKNIFYSALSIKMCLAMIRMGAVNETAEELDTALTSSVQGPEELANQYHDILEKYQKSATLKIASKIYVMKGYKARKYFYSSLTKRFFASMAAINFTKNIASANAINHWVKRQINTTDLIAAKQLTGDTRLVMVNAIHFNGEFLHAFNKQTYDTNFFINSFPQFKIKMMCQKRVFKYAYLEDLNASVLEMPYKDYNLSMVIIVPFGGLSELENNLSKIPFSNITDRMRFSEVAVHLPRFRIEFNAEFNKPLINMGLNRIFSNNAQLNNIVTMTEDLKVSNIMQKAVIEVKENETKIDKFRSCYTIGGDVLRADIPFYFAILDENKINILEGRINGEFDSFF